eukprot:163575_1
MAHFVKAYNNLLVSRPILMAAASTGVLGFVGDVFCQYIEHQHSLSAKISKKNNFKWDITRSCRFGGIGVCFGPQLSIWYSTLATRIFVGETFGIAMKRMLLDQSTFAPWAITFFFSLNTFIDGGSAAEWKERMRTQFIGTYKVNLMVWPATQLFNFWIVPPQYRVLIANFVALWWNTYLSYKSHISTNDEGKVQHQ